MASRVIGSSMGLLAFSTSVLAGLYAGNPPALILSRALWAMVLFFFMGLVVGWVVQTVVREHARLKEAEMLQEGDNDETANMVTEDHIKSIDGQVRSMGT